MVLNKKWIPGTIRCSIWGKWHIWAQDELNKKWSKENLLSITLVIVWTPEIVADSRSRSCNMWELCRDLLKRTLKFRSVVDGNNCRKRHLDPEITFCSFIIRRVTLLKLCQSSHRFFPASEAQNHKHEMILSDWNLFWWIYLTALKGNKHLSVVCSEVFWNITCKLIFCNYYGMSGVQRQKKKKINIFWQNILKPLFGYFMWAFLQHDRNENTFVEKRAIHISLGK